VNTSAHKSLIPPLTLAAIGTITLLVIAFVRAGAQPALSVLVGEASALVSVLGLAALGKILQNVQGPPKSGTGWLMLVGVFKLPIVLGGLYLAVRLAGTEPVPLIVAVILVYLCFVWFVARSRG
jgi:hypothetical protein